MLGGVVNSGVSIVGKGSTEELRKGDVRGFREIKHKFNKRVINRVLRKIEAYPEVISKIDKYKNGSIYLLGSALEIEPASFENHDIDKAIADLNDIDLLIILDKKDEVGPLFDQSCKADKKFKVDLNVWKRGPDEYFYLGVGRTYRESIVLELECKDRRRPLSMKSTCSAQDVPQENERDVFNGNILASDPDKNRTLIRRFSSLIKKKSWGELINLRFSNDKLPRIFREKKNEIIDLFKNGLSISLPVEEQEEISKYIAKELTIICNKNEQERPLLLQELEKYLGEKKLGVMLVQESWRRKKEEIKKDAVIKIGALGRGYNSRKKIKHLRSLLSGCFDSKILKKALLKLVKLRLVKDSMLSNDVESYLQKLNESLEEKKQQVKSVDKDEESFLMMFDILRIVNVKLNEKDVWDFRRKGDILKTLLNKDLNIDKKSYVVQLMNAMSNPVIEPFRQSMEDLRRGEGVDRGVAQNIFRHYQSAKQFNDLRKVYRQEWLDLVKDCNEALWKNTSEIRLMKWLYDNNGIKVDDIFQQVSKFKVGGNDVAVEDINDFLKLYKSCVDISKKMKTLNSKLETKNLVIEVRPDTGLTLGYIVEMVKNAWGGDLEESRHGGSITSTSDILEDPSSMYDDQLKDYIGRVNNTIKDRSRGEGVLSKCNILKYINNIEEYYKELLEVNKLYVEVNRNKRKMLIVNLKIENDTVKFKVNDCIKEKCIRMSSLKPVIEKIENELLLLPNKKNKLAKIKTNLDELVKMIEGEEYLLENTILEKAEEVSRRAFKTISGVTDGEVARVESGVDEQGLKFEAEENDAGEEGDTREACDVIINKRDGFEQDDISKEVIECKLKDVDSKKALKDDDISHGERLSQPWENKNKKFIYQVLRKYRALIVFQIGCLMAINAVDEMMDREGGENNIRYATIAFSIFIWAKQCYELGVLILKAMTVRQLVEDVLGFMMKNKIDKDIFINKRLKNESSSFVRNAVNDIKSVGDQGGIADRVKFELARIIGDSMAQKGSKQEKVSKVKRDIAIYLSEIKKDGTLKKGCEKNKLSELVLRKQLMVYNLANEISDIVNEVCNRKGDQKSKRKELMIAVRAYGSHGNMSEEYKIQLSESECQDIYGYLKGMLNF
ncbi:MAG: hypothetical protein CL503_06350 [Actinobacteria bacterium]|nr:hypothetical protein [Actinomycetota bacterium]